MSDKIKPSEVSQVLLDQLKGISSAEKFDEVGTVLTVSDGVARIYGLRNAEANECLLCRVMVAFAKLRVQSYYYFLNYTNIFDIFFQILGKT